MGRQVRGTDGPQSVSRSGPPLEGRLLTQAQFCLQLGRTLKARMVMA